MLWPSVDRCAALSKSYVSECSLTNWSRDLDLARGATQADPSAHTVRLVCKRTVTSPLAYA